MSFNNLSNASRCTAKSSGVVAGPLYVVDAPDLEEEDVGFFFLSAGLGRFRLIFSSCGFICLNMGWVNSKKFGS